MPITKSAKKEARKNIRRRVTNREGREALKKAVKQYRKLVAQKKFDEAGAFLPQVQKALDKSAKANLIKKNTASRLKSRLAKGLSRS
ncbi:MAG: 30S ribosomal protein S20 [Candidatus Liptonbacteria bacterium RIFCSPLOWO2_12_FULL_60_15]|uniref:Small ribosomal subunit protein bS20 n=2 Tax=Candidatus Liptoniibacteriota TaxID=1817909 RepID=A0A1G2CM47_9BACT|nr:MAG: 30S ribosomal protein S20 [Candidatus Liptonbacteria bacterium RIFCSPHIGHO2_12_FULL_60_13]OGZ02307.1 MAG: 30S ribosomal protein S20 [Candidatus Liptonbacteria bacterium RIFCSPLOWO2_12_FULL_60_15]